MRAILLALLGLAACGSDPQPVADAAAPADSAGIIPDAGPPPDAFGDHGTTTFTATKFGNPLWETTGWETYSVAHDPNALQEVFSQHLYHGATNAFGPRTPHQPPYDTEISDAVVALGFPSGDHFHFSEWDGAMLNFSAMIVPSAGAPTGQTFDYASGPIIPDAIQIYVDADMYKDDTIVDPDFDSLYPKLSTIDAAKTFDGWSHMTLSFGENTSFIPGTPGNYRLHVHLHEYVTVGNGWDIDIPFTVDP